jgi:hypothetical protein
MKEQAPRHGHVRHAVVRHTKRGTPKGTAVDLPPRSATLALGRFRALSAFESQVTMSSDSSCELDAFERAEHCAHNEK